MLVNNIMSAQKNIKVVILCGGLGTRMREETEFRPKPMVTIGGRPIVWHIMKIYSYYGFKDFVLCLGYKGGMIKEYFYNYEILNSDFTIEYGNGKHIDVYNNHGENGWRVTLVDTGDKALKGARLKRAQRYIDGETFMMTYGDGVSDINIKSLLAFHEQHGRLVTVSGVHPTSRFGELKAKGDKVVKFMEKKDVGPSLVSGGFFVCNSGIFDYLTYDEDCDFEIGALERIAEDSDLMVFRHSGFWAGMDTLRDVDYLNNLWHEGNAKWKVW